MAYATERKTLLLAWSAYFVGFVAHSAAHIYMWHHTPIAVKIAGFFADIAGFGVLALIVRRHPIAPIAMGLFGLGVAVSLSLIHLPPYWGPLSQPWRSDVNLACWLSLGAAVAGGLVAAAAGFGCAFRRSARDAADPVPTYFG